MNEPAPISLLISTYAGENYLYLQRALESIRDQTLAPAEVVLVVDGPVDAHQEAVIARLSSDGYLRTTMKVVWLAKNRGLAAALNIGIKHCSYPWVARLDSDDVAHPRRLEIQWEYLTEHPGIDLLASWHRECGEDGLPLGRVKTIPEEHEEIMKQLRWRNIISHPTIIFRREHVMQVGGYDEAFILQEDYELYARLAVSGARFAACQKVLVDVTSTSSQRKRRGGIDYLTACEWPARRRMCMCGFISVPFAVITALMRTVFVLSPGGIKWLLYRLVRTKEGTLAEGA